MVPGCQCHTAVTVADGNPRPLVLRVHSDIASNMDNQMEHEIGILGIYNSFMYSLGSGALKVLQHFFCQ